MKRVFGTVEAVFDILYLIAALVAGIVLISSGADNSIRMLAGIMALVLAAGDSFHLVPRIAVIMTKNEESWRNALGRGKQIASITMTVFYVILWHIGLLLFAQETTNQWSYYVYILAAVRIILCLAPQNNWKDRYPPVKWGILRNAPFLILGAIVAGLFFQYSATVDGLNLMWLAIAMSFLFYLPVVLWSNKNPKLGMLMLPKTCMYLWILAMFISI